MTEEHLELTVQVSASQGHAFDVFARELERWWPREYTWAKETLDTIGIEPREGGRCFERGLYGFTCDWGRVLTWEPPERLVLSWQIGPTRVPEPDPARASTVAVRFVAEDVNDTRVELEHRGFARHGEGAEGYRAAMGSEQGWPYMLDCYVRTVEAT